jgi:predicted nucleotidyltransferase
MRKNAADALFPGVRRDVLSATFRDPKRWWYLSELAEALGTSPSSLQRELESLAATSILERRREGRRTYYRAHQNSALFNELKGIVRKTMGVPAEIKSALAPLAKKISLAFLYGSVARGSDRADSDIDLLIVADDLTLEELYRRLQRVERKLRRKVNPTLYTVEEFRRRRNAGNSFLTKVLAGDRILVIGNEDGIDGAR